MFKRREFIKKSVFAAAFLSLHPLELFSSNNQVIITVLQTNDTHSHIDPFTSGRNKGLGGVARRTALIKKIRSLQPNTLLVDAGDIFQGTPYFNFFKGEVEFKTMSAMKYDAATLGNHEFDIGIDGLVKAMKYAEFPFVNVNYDYKNTPLNEIVKRYVIKTISGIRIAIFGVGVKLENLVFEKNYKGINYLDPLKTAEKMTEHLKNHEKVDLIICLSHLGIDGASGEIGGLELARSIPDIDIVVGGHSHTFMKKPTIINHPDGRQNRYFQVGFAGINLGRTDFIFQNKKLIQAKHYLYKIDSDYV
jgi:5'-nucleotidase